MYCTWRKIVINKPVVQNFESVVVPGLVKNLQTNLNEFTNF